MENGTKSPPGIIDAVSSWLRQGEDLRTKLQSERDELLARLKEVDEALANLPARTSQRPPSVPPPRHDLPARLTQAKLSRKSIPELIDIVAREHPEGLPAGAIVRSVREIKPSLKPTVIYPTIYRMRDDGRLLVRQENEQNLYLPKFDQPEDQATS